jgi:uncharacterized protein YndB with AHSA1/START domain
MTSKTGSPAEKTTGREFVISRVFNASRERVFKAWTDPKQLAIWWGPQGFTNPVCKIDARPGGAIHIDMRGPDGTVYPMSGAVTEINEPDLLAFTSAPLDEKGNPVFEVLTTVTFADEGGKTKLTVQAKVTKVVGDAAAGYLSGMDQGWNQSLDRLAAWVVKS